MGWKEYEAGEGILGIIIVEFGWVWSVPMEMQMVWVLLLSLMLLLLKGEGERFSPEGVAEGAERAGRLVRPLPASNCADDDWLDRCDWEGAGAVG